MTIDNSKKMEINIQVLDEKNMWHRHEMEYYEDTKGVKKTFVYERHIHLST